MRRRALMAGVGTLALSGAAATWMGRDERAVALVYRGPASVPGCPEAVAALIDTGPVALRAVFCGPQEKVPLSSGALAEAAVFAQPGGGTLREGWEHMRPYARAIREFTAAGGRYLGFCLGGYLAGATPGFALLPGDTARYIDTAGAAVRTPEETVVPVRWRNQRRHLFFQDGPVFRLREGGVTVLARYGNGEIAAAVAGYGAGTVGVVGPHPEADRSWYRDGVVNPDGIRFDLGHDLIAAVMAEQTSS
ncbi:BPL-N domain-containing protein [Rhodococcus aetherivorans]|uniref:BPL-N domain-containing protein n=1 Tax=Rhodococcus aetherivorans TaxID=191292 RepID=UPI0021A56514|nr:BPL-N domain-containing protein [Rhodococcus aetherivorans]